MNDSPQSLTYMYESRLLDIDADSTCRHSESMESKSEPSEPRASTRQIVEFSLPPELATEVKIEAARRNMSLHQLFIEMWSLYKTNKPA